MFGGQKEQVEKDYLDLTMIHYPHHKKYLDFMALQEGSIDRQSSLAYKEVLILISLVIEYLRTGLHKKDFESFTLKKKQRFGVKLLVQNVTRENFHMMAYAKYDMHLTKFECIFEPINISRFPIKNPNHTRNPNLSDSRFC